MTPRQKATVALQSVQQLPEHEQQAMLNTRASVNTRVLTRNMTAYFEGCILSDAGVPTFSMQEFTDSLADALMRIGKKHHLGSALLQTLVIELQDRVNTSVSK